MIARASHLALVLTLVVALGAGCAFCGAEPPGFGGAAEAGVVVLDSGLPPPPDAGPDGGADAGPDAGDDGGTLPYDGGPPEPGVRCGAELTPCADDVPCCVSITGFQPEITTAAACAGPVDGGPPMCVGFPLPPFAFGCDDSAVDCDLGQVCCFRGVVDLESFVLDINTTCRADGDCAAEGEAPVCTTTSDCAEGLLCCGAGSLDFPLPIDLGICQESCELALPDGGIGLDAGL